MQSPSAPSRDNRHAAKSEAVALAAELIERESGRFEPKKMSDQYAVGVRELIEAKLEQRAPEIAVVPVGKPETAVINIMDALKESMKAKGRAKARDKSSRPRS